MPDTDLESSFVTKSSYNPDTQRLTLTLSGKDYDFDGVPQSVVDGLCQADSCGAYYAANIRGQYPKKEN